MIGPANPRQRLIVAAAVAFVPDCALGLADTRFLPADRQTLTLHRNSFVQPAGCVALVISLFFGGWIGGRRFLQIGVALVLALQLLAAIGALAGAAVHRRRLLPPLPIQESS